MTSADLQDDKLVASCMASPIATVMTNPRLPDNPVIAANASFSALTGYPPSEIVGRNCRFLAGPRTEPWLTDRIRIAITSRQPTLVELLNFKRDGTPFRNALIVAPIFDEEGELAWFIGSQVEVGTGTNAPTELRQQRAIDLVRGLSPRQRDVLREMSHGYRNKQIAWKLALSEKTVKMHRAILLKKLSIGTSAEAIRIAIEAGL